MKYLLLSLTCALVTGASLFGQKAKDNREPEKWPVELRLNLAVVDEAKRGVADLKPEDIKLFENDVEQKVTFVAKRPLTNIVFLVDNTGSLRQQFPQVIGIGNVLVDNIRPTDEASVMRFVGRGNITILQPWTTDKALLKNAFSNMQIEGGQSAVRDAIHVAAEKLLEIAGSKKETRLAVVLISDGEDRDSSYHDSDIFSLIDQSDIQIFTLGLTVDLDTTTGIFQKSTKNRSEDFLNTLADRSGGSAYIMGPKSKQEDLQTAVISLLNELRSPFVIGYTSTNQKHGGDARKLRIEIADGPNGQKRTAVFKKSLIVPKY